MNKLIVEMDEQRAEFRMDPDDFTCEQKRDVKPKYPGPGEADYKDFGKPTGFDVGATSVTAQGKFLEMIRSEVVWQNECQLVFEDDGLGTVIGEMGLHYPTGDGHTLQEVNVTVRETGPRSELMDKLRGKSVRITIEVVPEGNK